MLTVIVSNNHTSDDLSATLKSVRRAARSEKPQVIVLNTSDFEFDKSGFEELDISFVDKVKNHSMTAFAKAVKQAKGSYTLFLNSGDVLSDLFLNHCEAIIRDCVESVVALEWEPVPYEQVSKAAFRGAKAVSCERINLKLNPQLAPHVTTAVLFKTSALLEEGLDTSLMHDGLKKAMLSLMAKTDSFMSVSGVVLRSAYPTESDSVNFPRMHRIEWYYDALEKFLLPSLRTLHGDGRAKAFVQYHALWEMKWRFIYNRNANDKHITEKDFDRFYALCEDIFREIDNNVLFNLDNAPDYRMTAGMTLAMFHIKYGEKVTCGFAFDNANIMRVYKDVVLAKSKQLRIILELLEYENGVLTVEASVDDFLDMRECSLECYLNGEPLEFEETYRYAHTKFFGYSTNKRYTFRFRLPDSALADTNSITFFVRFGTYRVRIPITTRRYTAKFSTAVPYSYWMYGDDRRMVCSSDEDMTLTVTRLSKGGRFAREVKLMLGMLTGKEKAPGMLFTRLCYWITHPHYKKQRIWLTYDKLYKGGDCGEYFYKYMKSQNDGITPVYVINRDAEDVRRLHKEGFRPTYFGTLKNKLQYLNAEVVFATHGGVHTFNGISNSRAKFVCDLIHADVTCIQHGLSVQQLAQELNKLYNNTKRYYCASKYEIKNLEHPIYGYEDKSALLLTGIPRYDGLVSNDQKQILITPTWRAYISMPPVMGQSRPYYPEFKNTAYYQFYYNLLTDEKLIATARKTGYKLIYLLHPIISSQIVDYPDIDGVEIIPATEVNYEKILTESSLMLTDYSGVQFDFAYMRKPVVYYHPPELPPHYKEGGFFYDTMGFGEICTEHKGMVDCLCEYMENGCRMKPFYKDRADDFFAFSDLDSCKRIYDDMIAYQKKKLTNK